jgi:acetyltransferase-like isoleucine patch superfamily enzyme
VRTITFFLPDVPLLMRFRGFLYSLMMKRAGGNFQVTSSAIINSLAGFTVGRDVYIAQNTVIIGTDVTIGDEVIIGPNCVISGGNHVYSGRSYRFAKSEAAPVVLESGCWVGGNCSILAGTTLPEGSVLGAGSVLDKTFQNKRCLYAGVPARPVKEL